VCHDARVTQHEKRLSMTFLQNNLALQPTRFVVRIQQGVDENAVITKFHSSFNLWVNSFEKNRFDTNKLSLLEKNNIRNFWLGHLVGVLSNYKPNFEAPSKTFLQAWSQNDPIKLANTVRSNLGTISVWLDHFDDLLHIKEKQMLIVEYNILDIINNSPSKTNLASSLMTMWLSLTNRYERLRSKIFIREGLFQTSLIGVDASKLITRSVKIPNGIQKNV